MTILNQNKMKIEIITPTLEEKGFGKRECRSMYEAHSHKIYNDANGYPTYVYVDGVLQDGLSEDLQHPDTYIVKKKPLIQDNMKHKLSDYGITGDENSQQYKDETPLERLKRKIMNQPMTSYGQMTFYREQLKHYFEEAAELQDRLRVNLKKSSNPETKFVLELTESEVKGLLSCIIATSASGSDLDTGEMIEKKLRKFLYLNKMENRNNNVHIKDSYKKYKNTNPDNLANDEMFKIADKPTKTFRYFSENEFEEKLNQDFNFSEKWSLKKNNLNQINKMTAVEQFWQEIQDILPSSVDTETGIKMLRAFDKFKDIEKKQHQETWESAHQAGRFEGKGIAEPHWQTWETYCEENFNQEK